MRVGIVPFALSDPGALDRLARDLAAFYDCKADVLTPGALPEKAYDKRRGQYRSDAFLSVLRGMRTSSQAAGAPGGILLGVTEVDLFAERLSFVFGEADRQAAAAVVSLKRLRPDSSAAAGRLLLHERLLKEAVHECGHVTGLDHCPEKLCVMHFSNSVDDTDLKGPGFCLECERKLVRLLSRD